LAQCDINDISIEEEDIGNVVERIYANGNQTIEAAIGEAR